MIGLGSAFRLPGLQQFLSEKLQLDVRKLQKLERLGGEARHQRPGLHRERAELRRGLRPGAAGAEGRPAANQPAAAGDPHRAAGAGQEAVGGGGGGGPAAGHGRPGLELRPGVPLGRYPGSPLKDAVTEANAVATLVNGKKKAFTDQKAGRGRQGGEGRPRHHRRPGREAQLDRPQPLHRRHHAAAGRHQSSPAPRRTKEVELAEPATEAADEKYRDA